MTLALKVIAQQQLQIRIVNHMDKYHKTDPQHLDLCLFTYRKEFTHKLYSVSQTYKDFLKYVTKWLQQGTYGFPTKNIARDN